MKPGDIPGFEMIERIGKGGMAEVWKARQLSLDRIVAIKMLTTQALPDDHALARFRTETRAAAKLNHPGIVQVYDTGEVNNVPYCVMEFVEGRTLGDVLEEHGRLDTGTAMLIAEHVALGLAHAWEKARIIHLDIKPDNIMVASDGAIKIADLGLARMVDALGDEPSELVLGTPNYTSPEQAQGLPDLDCRSDIYSLGAMLYHLVTGILPFAGSRGSEAMDKHITGYLPDPLEVNPQLPASVAWLVEKLMVKDRTHRPQSWDVVLRDVKSVRAGEMPDPPLPEAGESTVRRSPARTRVLDVPAKPAAGGRRRRVVNRDENGAAAPAGAAPAAGPAPAGPSVGRAFLTLLLLGGLAGGVYYFLLNSGYLKNILPAPAQGTPPAAAPKVPTPAPAPAPAPGPATRPTQPVTPPAPRVNPTPAPNVATVPNPAPAQPAPAPAPSGGNGMKVDGWDDPDYVKAALLFNSAVETYTQFQQTRENRESLKDAEAKAREAVRLFQQVKTRAPNPSLVDRRMSDCYRLISDVRLSTQL